MDEARRRSVATQLADLIANSDLKCKYFIDVSRSQEYILVQLDLPFERPSSNDKSGHEALVDALQRFGAANHLLVEACLNFELLTVANHNDATKSNVERQTFEIEQPTRSKLVDKAVQTDLSLTNFGTELGAQKPQKESSEKSKTACEAESMNGYAKSNGCSSNSEQKSLASSGRLSCARRYKFKFLNKTEIRDQLID